ncbi:hypothetical protein RND81_03G226800 [Saponaria officinalis]|uniref:Protein kinase domain-containing protein n=1 Tax=Saponaria officinalis TaxID=3572 RepID=A0AAW1M9N7_SAPOF
MPCLVNALFFTYFLTLTQLHAKPTSNFTRKSQINPKVETFDQKCNETCGVFQVSYPFYINNPSCGYSNSFQLSCLNSTSLFLNINSQNYRVLEFFSDGILVNFPGFSYTCHPYNDLNSFNINKKNDKNNYFGISSDNIIGLYDCEDSSLCRANCEANDLPDCNRVDNGPACCYPLSDNSVWQIGDDFGVFSKYECRGFSSWIVPRGNRFGKRGVKLEWGVPMNISNEVCDVNAQIVNATSVINAIRCICNDGFVGDGYTNGTQCLKSCFKNGKEEFGKNCEPGKHLKRKIIILAVLTSTLAAVFLLTLLCLIRRSAKPDNNPRFGSTLSFRKSCNTRLFTLTELHEATNGFDEGQNKLMDGCDGTVFRGTLKDCSGIAVQKIRCQNEQELIQVLTRIELLSSTLHRHLAHIFGCCIDSGYTPMVIYEFPENGTLHEHLRKGNDDKIGLDWFKRLSIATQTASLLAFLQHEISPTVSHHDLKTSSIFLDEEYNVKIACFAMLVGSNLYRSDVYDFGVVLLEIISGSNQSESPTAGLQKIREGKIEEMVDPLLYYHEQPPFRKEQIEVVADIATRCLIFGGDGKLRMVDVARELVHIMKESIDGGSRRGPALEETFSNSSLLQMISMSPDSIYLPSKV